MRAVLVAVSGALVALAIWRAVSEPETGSGAPLATPPRAHAPAPAAAPPALATAGTPPRVVRAIERALDRHVEAAGLAERLSAADRTALRDALVATRQASLRSRRRSRDGAWQGEQSRALVAADRLFREKLGMGLADFMADAGPAGRVEDLGQRPAS